MTEESIKKYLSLLNLGTPYYTYSDLAESLSSCESKIANRLAFSVFLAQSAYETMGFTKFIENLYYTSAIRIKDVWPRKFYLSHYENGKYNAYDYVRNPVKLANTVYANRMGNGSIESGDGYRYRGRGAFHLTGKNNYAQCSNNLYNDNRFLEKPDLVEECFYAFETALWFWNVNNLTYYSNNFAEVTRRINGSTATNNNRLPYWKYAKQVLGL